MQDPFPPSASPLSRLRATQWARQRFRVDGSLPPGYLRLEIEASWRRSLGHGVCGDNDGLVNLREFRDLSALHHANRLLLEAAAPELDFLAEQCGAQGLVMLADADATILSVAGNARHVANLGIGDAQPGANWSESLRGTNAVGTALVEARPVAIDCGEHFLDRLSRFCCCAVPLRDPHGALIGALDLTREGELPLTHDTLSMLTNAAASHLETRLFESYFPEHIIVSIHPRRSYLGSIWCGVLAVDDNGRITAANEQACELLGITRAALIGRRCEGSAIARPMSFMSIVEQCNAFQIEGVQSKLWFSALRVPRRATSPARVTSSVPALDATAIPPEQGLERIAGRQQRLLRALTMARQGLNNGLPVLVQGETGTGKEVVARALHDASHRAGKPFIAVNCASIPEGLIESELFGYRDGAFTGARKGGMTGRLMQANGGTLFLDEIGDMPLQLQARLLRVLQERKVAPLGAGQEQAIDVAVICATHRDLQGMVQDKSFREDLYYRIHGVNVNLPALRDREDIDLIIATLLDRLGVPEIRVSDALLDVFRNHPWPGNIRQLEMVLRTALAVYCEDDFELGLDHLCDGFLDDVEPPKDAPCGLIQRCNDALIRKTLAQHGGNAAAAAQALGISRATMYRWIKRLGA